MSTILSIQIGALTRSRTYANDTKAQAALLAFYTQKNLGPSGATNAQKLDAILDWMTQHIAGTAQAQAMDTARLAAQTQAETDYKFE